MRKLSLRYAKGLAVALIGAQLLIAVPAEAASLAVAAVSSPVAWRMRIVAGTLGRLTAALERATARVAAASSAPSQASTRSAEKVVVNRKVPKVAAAPLRPVFAAAATEAEITRARVFEEPLLPVGPTGARENAVLARALLAYLDGGGSDALAPVQEFLLRFPDSPWKPALLTNLGIVYRRTGHFSRALSAWEQAWTATKAHEDPRAKPIGDRAIGELMRLNAQLGRYQMLEQLSGDIEGRDIRGSATEHVAGARHALWLMHNRSSEAFRCGPFALDSLLRRTNANYQTPDEIHRFKSTMRGTSLAQIHAVAQALGQPLLAIRRRPGSAVPVPSVVHWKVGHFAAIVDRQGDRLVMRDPTFGDDELRLRTGTLDEEASGYFLVFDQPLAAGWNAVASDEAVTVWGTGVGAGVDPGDSGPGAPPCGPPNCPASGGGPPGQGLAVASIKQMLVSLTLTDTPVWYTPPKGPAVEFTAWYNQREAFQPQTFSYSSLGQKWTFNWLSYITDDPTNASAPVETYMRGSGVDKSTNYNPSTQTYAPTVRYQAVVKRTVTSPVRYERELPDGSVEVFDQPDGASTFPRKVFLTEIKDPHGNALTFTYDASLRIVAATDALGQVTTLSYQHPTDSLKITKVTDPFGRFATFAYDSSGRLQAITDMIGLTSSFSYGTADAVRTLTTPYGTTTIALGDWSQFRWVEITDPLGGKERAQYSHGLTYSESSVPTGMAINNSQLNDGNTMYWDKRTMAIAPGDPVAAVEYQWAYVSSGLYMSAAVPLSIKRPLENRVWFNYKSGGSTTEGTTRKVTAIGRVLDDGSSQVWTYDYNMRGQMTKQTDPLGRETLYEYAANGLDLLTVKQKNGGGQDLLETRTWNGQHRPSTVTDAAGQTTTYTYNTSGQVLTVTNAKSETTTYTYSTPDSYLTSVTGPVTGATTSFTYDAYGRTRTVTDSDSYTVTIDYDLLNRPTKRTYPDTTFDQTVYDKLDAVQLRDRLGQWSRTSYDAVRRVTAMRDPAGRTVTQEWCSCGSLDALVDANGNRTHWERDVRARITKEVRANGSETLYVYENTTSRLKSLTDAKSQVMNFTYARDDQLTNLAYTNEVIATPDVSLTYDSIYGRLATMVDGTGTTTYGYHAVATPPALGATRLASVDGPLTNDTITYGYDALGRVTTRAINGAANTVTSAFDSLSRVTSEQNVLGTFAYTYHGTTDRLNTVTYPNNQTSTYSYFGGSNDHRLQTIHHKYPNATTLSKFDYTYDAVGNILTWRHQTDTTAVLWEYGYDRADQLTAAVKKADPAETVLKRYAYSYDPAGNRTAEQIDDAVTGASYDNMNRLVSQQAAGPMVFSGTVNEPATVTVQGKPATVKADNTWQGTASVMSGMNTVTIVATDPSGNVRTNTYEVSHTATATTFAYDANNNLTSDGIRTFEWDAANRLAAVVSGTHRSEFAYDGRDRRSRIVEKENGSTVRDAQLIWDGTTIAEERLSTGEVNRFFEHGEQHNGVARFVTSAHLGSVREVTDSTGAVVTRNDYDPYGRLTRISGSEDSRFGFTGHYMHTPSGLTLPWYRAYDSGLGRWLTDDPIGLAGGLNLQQYVRSNPVRYVDPDGRNPLVGVLEGVVIGGGLGGIPGAIIGGIIGGIIVGGAAVLVHHQFVKPPKDAYDPKGPKAPGKPTEADGFRDPKGGEDWVRNPNGKGAGWLDENGEVWVPTGWGGTAHGGPHWDVQSPGGGYRNVWPPKDRCQ
jgi:RHS repeat-associated protein